MTKFQAKQLAKLRAIRDQFEDLVFDRFMEGVSNELELTLSDLREGLFLLEGHYEAAITEEA